MNSSAAIALILVLIFGIALIVGASYLDKSKREKAENDARVALQAVLDPGEQLVEFTIANTKGGASLATSVLAGPLLAGVASAVNRAGGMELYVGLTNNRIILTPVQPADSRTIQAIPRGEIKSIEAKAYTTQDLTLTIHSQNGDLVMYTPNKLRWIRKGTALKNAFDNR
jgi:hypothetical protein